MTQNPFSVRNREPMKCQHCQDRQVVQEGNRMNPCPYCMTAERLMASINRAIADSKKEGNKELAKKLRSVLQFLPDYPVMATMEAEALGLNHNLTLLIRDTFSIVPFGDQEYKRQKKIGGGLTGEVS